MTQANCFAKQLLKKNLETLREQLQHCVRLTTPLAKAKFFIRLRHSYDYQLIFKKLDIAMKHGERMKNC